jgi:hypothetical protein
MTLIMLQFRKLAKDLAEVCRSSPVSRALIEF